MKSFHLPYPKHSAGAAVVMCGDEIVCDCSLHIQGAKTTQDFERVNAELDRAREFAEMIVETRNFMLALPNLIAKGVNLEDIVKMCD